LPAERGTNGAPRLRLQMGQSSAERPPHPDPLPEGEGAEAGRPVGIVVGLVAEAKVAGSLGARIAIGGGTSAGAASAADTLAPRVSALISFGLAGGLDPALPPGALLIPATVLAEDGQWDTDPILNARLGGPTPGALFGDGAILATTGAKAALHARTGAVAVDLESAAVARIAARHGLPFAVLRAVCDPAGRDLPRAALAALDGQGRIGALRVVAAILAQPGEILGLIALGRDAARARLALVTRVRAIGRLGSAP